VEAGLAVDLFAFCGEGGASSGDDFVEGLEGRDVFVDDGFVDQRPQRFGRLVVREKGFLRSDGVGRDGGDGVLR
jgi:hypothetical protein